MLRHHCATLYEHYDVGTKLLREPFPILQRSLQKVFCIVRRRQPPSIFYNAACRRIFLHRTQTTTAKHLLQCNLQTSFLHRTQTTTAKHLLQRSLQTNFLHRTQTTTAKHLLQRSLQKGFLHRTQTTTAKHLLQRSLQKVFLLHQSNSKFVRYPAQTQNGTPCPHPPISAPLQFAKSFLHRTQTTTAKHLLQCNLQKVFCIVRRRQLPSIFYNAACKKGFLLHQSNSEFIRYPAQTQNGTSCPHPPISAPLQFAKSFLHRTQTTTAKHLLQCNLQKRFFITPIE